MVFFDESGKKKDKPLLMGGLAIPKSIYQRPEFSLLQGTSLHWTAYTGFPPDRKELLRVINSIKPFENLMRLTVINYDQSLLEKNARPFPSHNLSLRTIYTKFPERIIYGLLRKFGKHTHLNAELIIENSTEYQTFNLPQLLSEQLNIQSLYRGENFSVLHARLEDKGKEIGLEITDLLLGILRTIIKNPSPETSNREKEKLTLILHLLQDPAFHSLLTARLRYYEWTSAHELTEVDFSHYLQAFLSRHHTRWLPLPFFEHNG